MQQSQNMVQSPNAVPMTDQLRRLWANIETALVEFHMFAHSLQQTRWYISVGPAS